MANLTNKLSLTVIGAIGGGLLIAWLSSAKLPQPQVATIEKPVPICPPGVSFVQRRLDSDQQEEFCATYRGKVVLVVNTASRCGYTGQYKGLESLYASYRDAGLVVVGFPSNDFGNQEPGSEESIEAFCRLNYGVQFPMYAKTLVKGEGAAPLYKALSAAGGAPRWNFHKYLVDRQGQLTGSFGSATGPESAELINAIEALL